MMAIQVSESVFREASKDWNGMLVARGARGPTCQVQQIVHRDVHLRDRQPQLSACHCTNCGMSALSERLLGERLGVQQ